MLKLPMCEWGNTMENPMTTNEIITSEGAVQIRKKNNDTKPEETEYVEDCGGIRAPDILTQDQLGSSLSGHGTVTSNVPRK